MCRPFSPPTLWLTTENTENTEHPQGAKQCAGCPTFAEPALSKAEGSAALRWEKCRSHPNLIRQRIAEPLTRFVRAHRLGVVVQEMDFRLGPDTVRNPDVAIIASEHLKSIDLDSSPVEGAPVLAIESSPFLIRLKIPSRRCASTWRRARVRLGSSIPHCVSWKYLRRAEPKDCPATGAP